MKKIRTLLTTLTLLVAAPALVKAPTQANPFPFGFWKKSASSFCTGQDGAVNLSDGSALHIVAGSTKQYSSISLSGGSRIVLDPGTGWTVICVSGNVTIDGGDGGSGIYADAAETSFNQTITRTAPDGTALAFTYVDTPSGDGGADGSGFNTPGVGAAGSAGGGAGLNNGEDGSPVVGGNGGASFGGCDFGGNSPGLGGFAGNPGQDGTDALDDGCQMSGGFNVGPGGGAAGRGFDGASVYLKVMDTLTVSGFTFYSNGGSGGNGGAGAGITALSGGTAFGGGGGGGGSSGSAGSFVVKAHLGTASVVNSAAGSGMPGLGGLGGSASDGEGAKGIDGGYGEDGAFSFTNF